MSSSNIPERFQSAHQAKKRIIACTYCLHSPVPAVKTCLHCETSLCEEHLQRHCMPAKHDLTEPTASLENRKCSVHKKVLEYYCCKDATCICVSCSLTGEHRGHRVDTLNEAFEKKKKKLRNTRQKLTSQREEAEKRVQSLQELRRKVQGKEAGVTKGVTALIRDIREQLEALGKRVLSEISRQKEQVSLRVSDLIQKLEKKKEDLSRKMGHIKKLCNMTNPLKVLQERESDRADYCDAEEGDNEDTERHDIKVHDAGDLDVGLISVILHSGLARIVTGIMRQRRVPEASDTLPGVNTASDTLPGVNTASDMLPDVNMASDRLLDVNMALDMLLDVDTAGNNVSVSKDLKTASYSEVKLSHSRAQKRFQFNQVLSSRSFSSGRHYWEVEGSESGGWAVGMTYPSIDRRGRESLIGNNNKSWGLVRNKLNAPYCVRHDSMEIELPHPPSCRRLGIFLSYEVGRLSFYELGDPVRHLHTFTAAFTEPLHAIFGVYEANAWVRI